jgi:hypothetical protein
MRSQASSIIACDLFTVESVKLSKHRSHGESPIVRWHPSGPRTCRGELLSAGSSVSKCSCRPSHLPMLPVWMAPGRGRSHRERLRGSFPFLAPAAWSAA